jgi:hypothetical protein
MEKKLGYEIHLSVSDDIWDGDMSSALLVHGRIWKEGMAFYAEELLHEIYGVK